jgi:hypothetical protein
MPPAEPMLLDKGHFVSVALRWVSGSTVYGRNW